MSRLPQLLALRPPSLVTLAALLALAPGCLDGGGGGDVDGSGADAAVDTTVPRDGAAPEDTAAPVDSAPAPDAVTDHDAADAQDALVLPDTAAPAGSCAGRCGEYDAAAPCQCDPSCTSYDNCCADHAALCAPVASDTDFLRAQGSECVDPASWFRVTHVRDGDTVDLATGDAVRFLLVDTPEVSSDDCQAREAKAFTYAAVLGSGWEVCLVADPTSEDRDLYDRLLRYVYVREPLAEGEPVNLNVRLIRLGDGRLMYPYAYGRVYEEVGKAMQAKAQQEGQGGWGSCGW